MFIDLTQVLLVLVITVLTALLVVVGVQVYFILRDLRSAIGKLDKVLTDLATISEKTKQSLASFSAASAGFKTIAAFLHFLAAKFGNHERDQQ